MGLLWYFWGYFSHFLHYFSHFGAVLVELWAVSVISGLFHFLHYFGWFWGPFGCFWGDFCRFWGRFGAHPGGSSRGGSGGVWGCVGGGAVGGRCFKVHLFLCFLEKQAHSVHGSRGGGGIWDWGDLGDSRGGSPQPHTRGLSPSPFPRRRFGGKRGFFSPSKIPTSTPRGGGGGAGSILWGGGGGDKNGGKGNKNQSRKKSPLQNQKNGRKSPKTAPEFPKKKGGKGRVRHPRRRGGEWVSFGVKSWELGGVEGMKITPKITGGSGGRGERALKSWNQRNPPKNGGRGRKRGKRIQNKEKGGKKEVK